MNFTSLVRDELWRSRLERAGYRVIAEARTLEPEYVDPFDPPSVCRVPLPPGARSTRR
jgi:hypothetical protein